MKKYLPTLFAVLFYAFVMLNFIWKRQGSLLSCSVLPAFELSQVTFILTCHTDSLC